MENIILWIWVILILIIIFNSIRKEKQEGFTPKINGLYRPHLRNLRLSMESLNDYYSVDYFVKKFRDFGIY